MSPAGSSTIAGFTLLELLAVLLVIGLIGALVPGFVLRNQPSLELDRATRALTDGLRRTRSDAMLTNRERRFALDVDAHQFRAGSETVPVTISRDIAIALRTARSEQFAEAGGTIRFFPDGSATGGAIALSKGDQRRLIEIDWLTGTVSETIDVH